MLWNDFLTPVVTQLTRSAAFVPATDLTASDHDFVLTMDVPGLTTEEVSIELVDGYVVVRGERKRPELAEGTSWLHSERTFGKFERLIKVPEGVDPDAITASIDSGVLSVIVPKPERPKPKTIAINAGSAQRELETAAA